jgi:hypothetical protein
MYVLDRGLFLVLDEGRTALAHHLLRGFEGGCFFGSVFCGRCWLIEATSASSSIFGIKEFFCA